MKIATESVSKVNVWSNFRAAINATMADTSALQVPWSRVVEVSDSHEKLVQKDGQILRRLVRDLGSGQVTPLNPLLQSIAEATVAIAGSGERLQQLLAGTPSLQPETSNGSRLSRGERGLPATLSRHSDDRREVLRFARAAADGDARTSVIRSLESEKIVERNKYVIHFLKKNNAEIFHDRLSISSQSLLRATIDCLIRNPLAERQLSRRILKDLTCEQAATGADTVLPERADATWQWLSGLLFEHGIDAFIIRHLGEAQSDAEWSSAGLHEAFRQKIYSAVLAHEEGGGVIVHDAAVAHFIFEKVIYQVAPALRYAKAGTWVDLRQLEWGKVNAGLLFAQRHGADISHFSEAEALAVGSMLLVAIAAGQASVAVQDLFVLAAQCHAVLTSNDPDCDGTARAVTLASYFTFNAQFTDAHCPLAAFSRLEQNFLTRTQLAQQRVDRECPQMSVTNLLNTDDVALCLYPFTSGIGKYLLAPVAKWLSSYVLPETFFIRSVNDDYRQQVREMAAAYATLDRILSFVALSGLGEQEEQFINHARLQKMQVSFDARHLNYYQSAGRNQALQGHLNIGLAAGVDVYAARHDGQERMYALRRTRTAYKASRIDRNTQEYMALAENSRPVNDPDYLLKINGDGKPLAQKKDGMFGELLQRLSEEHRDDFAKQIYALGFEATGLQQVEAFLLSLLPFYTCVTELEQGRHEAILACAFDVVLLFSAIGNVGRIALKAGDPAVKAGLMALRSTTGEVAARHAARAGTVARSPVSSLSRTVNPGVVPAGSAAMTELESMLNFGGAVKSYLPALETALPKLTFVQKVSIIRRQGLSGGHGLARQAGHQARQPAQAGSSMWAAQRAIDTHEVDAVLLRHLQGKKINAHEMARLAREHNVDLHALSNHITRDGQLTELGQRVLAQADALAASAAAVRGGAASESGRQFADEIAEWLSLGQQQRAELGGIRGFASRHQVDPADFERVLAQRNLLPRLSEPVRRHGPVTATLLRDWQAWRASHGASNDSILKFWNGRHPSLTDWVRHVKKDGSLTARGKNLIDSQV